MMQHAIWRFQIEPRPDGNSAPDETKMFYDVVIGRDHPAGTDQGDMASVSE
jgi:hypothetical protein